MSASLQGISVTRLAVLVTSVLVATMLISGCGTAEIESGQAPTEPEIGATTTDAPRVPTDDPISILPTPPPDSPYILTEAVTLGDPLTPEEIAPVFDFAIMGTVVNELPAQWTTADGLRPENPFESAPGQYAIVTPYVIELGVPEPVKSVTTSPVIVFDRTEDEPSLNPNVKQVVIVVERGKVGKDEFQTNDPNMLFHVGDQVLVAVTESKIYDPDRAANELVDTPAGPGWWAGDVKYVFTKNNNIQNYAGVRNADTFVQALMDAAENPLLAPRDPIDQVTPVPTSAP